MNLPLSSVWLAHLRDHSLSKAGPSTLQPSILIWPPEVLPPSLHLLPDLGNFCVHICQHQSTLLYILRDSVFQTLGPDPSGLWFWIWNHTSETHNESESLRVEPGSPLTPRLRSLALLCLVTQSRPAPCDPTDCSPPGSSVYWGVSRREYWSGLPGPPPGDLPHPGKEPRPPALQTDSLMSGPPERPLLPLLLSRLSRVRLCATPQTAAHQAPPSLGFSRQERCSGLPFPSPMCESEVAQSCPTCSDPTRAIKINVLNATTFV